jgi:DNA-binding response OmpR family regulator
MRALCLGCSPSSVSAVREILSNLWPGADVDEAEDLVTGFGYLVWTPPDVVFVANDSAWSPSLAEAIGEVRSHALGHPLIALVGAYGDGETVRISALDAGADDCIEKTESPDRAEAKVLAVVRRTQRLQAAFRQAS